MRPNTHSYARPTTHMNASLGVSGSRPHPTTATSSLPNPLLDQVYQLTYQAAFQPVIQTPTVATAAMTTVNPASSQLASMQESPKIGLSKSLSSVGANASGGGGATAKKESSSTSGVSGQFVLGPHRPITATTAPPVVVTPSDSHVLTDQAMARHTNSTTKVIQPLATKSPSPQTTTTNQTHSVTRDSNVSSSSSSASLAAFAKTVTKGPIGPVVAPGIKWTQEDDHGFWELMHSTDELLAQPHPPSTTYDYWKSLTIYEKIEALDAEERLIQEEQSWQIEMDQMTKEATEMDDSSDYLARKIDHKQKLNKMQVENYGKKEPALAASLAQLNETMKKGQGVTKDEVDRYHAGVRMIESAKADKERLQHAMIDLDAHTITLSNQRKKLSHDCMNMHRQRPEHKHILEEMKQLSSDTKTAERNLFSVVGSCKQKAAWIESDAPIKKERVCQGCQTLIYQTELIQLIEGGLEAQAAQIQPRAAQQHQQQQ